MPRGLLAALGVGIVTPVAVVAGPAVTAALALLGVAAWWQWRARVRFRTRIAALTELGRALRTMVGELNAGAHPAAAAETAAADSHGSTAATLRAVATSARLGGDPDVLPVAEAPHPAQNAAVARLTGAWSLAHRHGVPLAGVLEAVRGDVESAVRLAAQVDARMAGPRASAAILALLPAIGVAMGEAMGAGAVSVLTSTVAGQVLLVLGAALVLAGVVWSVMLTGRVSEA